MSISNIFSTIFFIPILNVLLLLNKLFVLIRLPGAFGFAIIGLTMIVRGLFHPFFKSQMETARKMNELKPHLDKLSEKHKGDQKKLQQEQLKLYQEAGINPASGCLFLIIQIPIFFALYQVLYEPFKHGSLAAAVTVINKMVYFPFLKLATIDPWFFGLNLALAPNKSGQWFYLLVPLITGVLQYFQAASMMPPGTPNQRQSSKEDSLHKKEAKKNDSEDFQKAMNTQMKFLFPLMIGWFSYTLPVGLSLYWNIFSIFSILQYRQSKTPNSKLQITNKSQISNSK